MNKFLTIIVPAAVVESARAMTDTWSNGSGMFTTALTSDGVLASHYISTGYMDGRLCSYLPTDTYSTVADEFGEPTTVVTKSAGDVQGLVDEIPTENPGTLIDLQSAQGVISVCDISTQSADDAMSRLGLTILTTTVE